MPGLDEERPMPDDAHEWMPGLDEDRPMPDDAHEWDAQTR